MTKPATCPEVFEDGSECGAPATVLINLPKDRKNPHAVCRECADFILDDVEGSSEYEAASDDPPPADAAEPQAGNKTPEEHSDLVGGSTASRRIHCPRSYALGKIAPQDKGNSYAREGTLLHEMIAIVIEQDKDPRDMLPFHFARPAKGAEEAWEGVVDDDLWFDLGQPALDAFYDFADEIEAETGAEFHFEVEQRCAMPGIPGAFGTTDVVWVCGYLSGVWDWKFGRTPVSADSDQLRFYGRSAASDHPKLFGADTWGDIDQDREVILSIMQPQCSDEPSEHRTTVGELEEFRVKLMKAIDEAVEQGDKARVQKGPWCNFATCKTVCPLHVGQSLAFGEKMAALAELKKEQGAKELRAVTGEVSDVEISFGDMLPDLLDLAETAKEFAAELMKQAHAYLEEGGTVEGWVLKSKRSSGREWVVDAEEVAKFMKNRRYTLDQSAPRKPLTMPQVETLLKKDGRTIPEEMYQAKPSSGTTLTRDGDHVVSVAPQSERMKALGSKLAALRDE